MTEGGTQYKRGRLAKRAVGRVENALAGTLEPGEELQFAVLARARPHAVATRQSRRGLTRSR
jgi:hypothetical protein